MEHKGQKIFIKDLSILKGIDLRNVLFVDNHIFSFAGNLRNGIPVVDFVGKKDDYELLKVANYVKNLAKAKNVMAENEKNFSLHKILMSNIENFIRYYEVKELSESQETDFDDDGDSIIELSSSSSFVSPIAQEMLMQN